MKSRALTCITAMTLAALTIPVPLAGQQQASTSGGVLTAIGTATVGGSGTTRFIPIWTGTTTLGNSVLFQNAAGDIGLGTQSPVARFQVINPTGDGVEALTLSSTGIGVYGISHLTGTGVRGDSEGNGVVGLSTTSTGVGVFGQNMNSGIGVEGTSKGFRGVVGNSDVKGGVVGFSTSGDGTTGVACTTTCSGAAIFGTGHRAGEFDGNVAVTGTLAVTGVKSFHIDHPLDPANKFLNHASVESNEVLNVYSGNIITGADGTATVELPDYFSALNGDFRYQLTVIGQFAQAIVFREIENNVFVVKTDKPAVKVSWQVTARRQDAWMRNHPMQVEEDKPEEERGYYLDPELFGQPEERSLSWLYHPDTMRDAKVIRSQEKTGAN